VGGERSQYHRSLSKRPRLPGRSLCDDGHSHRKPRSCHAHRLPFLSAATMRSGKISRQRCRHDEPQTHQRCGAGVKWSRRGVPSPIEPARRQMPQRTFTGFRIRPRVSWLPRPKAIPATCFAANHSRATSATRPAARSPAQGCRLRAVRARASRSSTLTLRIIAASLASR